MSPVVLLAEEDVAAGEPKSDIVGESKMSRHSEERQKDFSSNVVEALRHLDRILKVAVCMEV